jgi:glutaconate CoA-transferase subunit B
MGYASDATPAEIMCHVLASEVASGEIAIMGANSALPMLACRAAQLTHAPGLTFIAGGSGAINPVLERLPKSSCDHSLMDAEANVNVDEVIEIQARCEVDVFFAGGMQIDSRGNTNLVTVGPWENPKIRGPGTAGLGFFPLSGRIILYTQNHNPKTFVEKVDFISGPGRPDSNIELVVTPFAVMDFHDERMRLRSVHPGFTVKQVREETGFELVEPEKGWKQVPETSLPDSNFLKIIRKLDPDGIVTDSR